MRGVTHVPVMSDTIKRAILQKFHQFFALHFYNALRMFCDIKL